MPTSRRFRLSLLSLLSLVSFFVPSTPAEAKKPPAPPVAAPPSPDSVVRRLMGEALATDAAYDALESLCDGIGHRLAGSPELDRAIAWAQSEMKKDGLANVHAEPVMVPVWQRGEERAELVAPVALPLSMLGLGGSVGTPPGGITAEVVVATSFDELTALGEARVKGRIVLFDVPFVGYGETVKYRGLGASAAARLGAVASLVRSIGPISYDTPHTGAMFYQPGVPTIPTAALSIESATLVHRLSKKGVVRVHIEMGAKTLPDAKSANVIGEVVGREKPEEIVLIGAHLDSWDVGQGAQDDGAGVVEVLEAAHLLSRLGLHPRRTIRVVLFTNEESGLRGGKAYREAHMTELPRHVAVIESDSGSGPMQGFSIDVRPRSAEPPPPRSINPAPVDPEIEKHTRTLIADATLRLQKLTPYLEPLDATSLHPGHAGSDLEPMLSEGVLGLGADHDASHYFDVHHSRADTLEKVDRHTLRRNVAVMAVMAWLLGEML